MSAPFFPLFAVAQIVPQPTEDAGGKEDQVVDQCGNDDGPILPAALNELYHKERTAEQREPLDPDRQNEKEKQLHIREKRRKGEKQRVVQIGVGSATGQKTGDDGTDHADQIIQGKPEAAPFILQTDTKEIVKKKKKKDE